MKDIYVDDLGKGHAFVFVHGFLGSSEMWTLQKQHFKSKFRIISPALPGFGESHKAPSLNSINDMAKFVLDVIEEKKIQLEPQQQFCYPLPPTIFYLDGNSDILNWYIWG